ncbi:MAG TPA: FAD-dependent monooxygenase [Polyangiaceae bacterium]
MNVDIIIVGGGIGGSTLATVLARNGKKVLVLERETKFKDRVRGENLLPWGVATARRLGVLDDLVTAGGRSVPFFNLYTMGVRTERRPLSQTTPVAEGCLNTYHPDMQDALLAGAIRRDSPIVSDRDPSAPATSEHAASSSAKLELLGDFGSASFTMPQEGDMRESAAETSRPNARRKSATSLKHCSSGGTRTTAEFRIASRLSR